ncbi:lysylphosphatidylglycerol synthase transmembrane domain-containing protein [Natribaculum luteum]|uniref:Lysylphosphatidylglycerol synthase transmembrane domain-containing protein n=1 Tax=Natribaculum luteum TaxID=1586232 RepID=A0ABD5NX64_9EURY|nr:lysylphosphatidylglycerol synthase transmembrane domain-containing protein [Natribaculum luteum]
MDWRSILKTLVKAAVTAVALFLIIRTVPIRKFDDTLSEISPSLLAILVLVTVIQFIITSASLRSLLAAVEDVSLTTAIRIDATGGALNTLIPSRAGALLTVPALIAHRTTLSPSDGAKVKAIQFVGIASWSGIIGSVGLVIVSGLLPVKVLTPLALSAVIYLGFVAIALTAMVYGVPFAELLPSIIQNLTQGTISINRQQLVQAFGLLILSLLAPALRWILIAPAVDIELSLVVLLVAPTVAYLPTVLPISFGGIGVAELSGVAVLTALSGDPTAAAALVFVDRVIGDYLPLLGSGLIATVDLWILEYI